MVTIQDLKVSDITWHSAVMKWKFAEDVAVGVVLAEECMFSSDKSKTQIHYRGKKKSCKVVGLSPDSSYTFTVQIDPNAKKNISIEQSPPDILSRENSATILKVKSNEKNTRYHLSPVPNIVVTPSDDEEVEEEDVEEGDDRGKEEAGEYGDVRVKEEIEEEIDTDPDDMPAGVSASQLPDHLTGPGHQIPSDPDNISGEGSSDLLLSGSNGLHPSITVEGPGGSTGGSSNGSSNAADKVTDVGKPTEGGKENEDEVPVKVGEQVQPTEGTGYVSISTRIPSAENQKLVVRFRTKKSGKHDAKLVQAIEEHNTEEVKRICVESPDVINIADQTGSTPVMVAARRGYSSIIQILHQNGGNINGANTGGKTALMIGAYNGHVHIVSLLMELGCNWRKLDNTGCSALHYAVERGNVDICSSIVERGADVNMMDQRGYTPLMAVCLGDEEDVDMVNYLLKNKADPNLHCPGRETPLMAAVRTQKPETAKLLIDYKANVKEMSKHGFTAQDMSSYGLACFKLISDNIASDDSDVDNEGEESYQFQNKLKKLSYTASR